MEKRNHIESLFRKYINRQASIEETNELFIYFGISSENELRQLIDNTFSMHEDDNAEASASEQNVLNRLDAHLYHHIQPLAEDKIPIARKRLPIVRWAAAAAVLIVAGWAISYWQTASIPVDNANTSVTTVPDLQPGRPRATLTLDDGRTIELKETAEGITIVNDQVKYNDGHQVTKGLAVSQRNTISTPRGGQYHIILSDGTKVWLNAASTLRYPGAFQAQERIVELNGEGYFEVAKNPQKPFKVISKGQVVQVLGTHFNINSYSDESSIKTTLLEGAVKVTASDTDQSVKLSPGKQSILTKAGVQVQEADTEAVMAWKNDDFIFKGQDLKTTMRQLARWYNVEIVYANSAPLHLKIGGSISRKNSLSSVLKAMESTNSIKLDFDGKTILVK